MASQHDAHLNLCLNVPVKVTLLKLQPWHRPQCAADQAENTQSGTHMNCQQQHTLHATSTPGQSNDWTACLFDNLMRAPEPVAEHASEGHAPEVLQVLHARMAAVQRAPQRSSSSVDASATL
jgi:hypothetical protein